MTKRCGVLRPAQVVLLLILGVSAGCGGESSVAATNQSEAMVRQEPFSPPPVSMITPQDLAAAVDAERGKVLVVNFWATWCPPCVKEMPDLVKFYLAADGDETAFISVSADLEGELERALKPFVQKRRIPFPVYVINALPDEMLEALGWETDWDGALPATFVLDSQGEMRKTWIRGITFEELSRVVEAVRSDRDGHGSISEGKT